MVFDGATKDPIQQAVRDALIAFMAATAEAQAIATREAQKAGIAAAHAILAVPTAIAGIYGMNFKYMPELESPTGYYWVLGVIFTVCLTLFWRFRKSGWL